MTPPGGSAGPRGTPRETIAIEAQVNGRRVRAQVPAHRMLLDFLRDDLALTGAKRACDVQVCGACTVLVDGLPVSACTYLAFEIDGKAVETCEGLARDGKLHRIQQAFVDAGASQCGFCTPGMIMISKALLADHPDPSVEEIKEYLHGNICRCTGYKKIIEAIQAAAKVASEGETETLARPAAAEAGRDPRRGSVWGDV